MMDASLVPSLAAGPLGHLTLPDVALALVLGSDVSLGAFPFVILGVGLTWLLEQRTRLPMEALTALVFATGVALAFLVLPIQQAEAALAGDIARTTVTAAWVTAGMCAALVLVIRWRYRALVLVNVSEDLVASAGVRVARHNLLYLRLIAVIVALGVKVVGSLPTAALVAVPAAAGILIAAATGLPAGPLVVIASAALFLVMLLL
jgi:ABC-type Mn2+/Zn2+ transport system permease subunit